MPYKIVGNSVFKQDSSGRWILLKAYATHAKALAYFRALQANVKH